MSPATKEQAIVKLKGIEDKIGYPNALARLFDRHDRARQLSQQRRAGHIV